MDNGEVIIKDKIKRFIKVRLLKRDISTQIERLKDNGTIVGDYD